MKVTFNQNSNNIFGARIITVPQMKNSIEVNLEKVKLRGYTAFIGGDLYTPQNEIMRHDLLFYDSKLIAIDDFDEKSIKQKIKYVLINRKTITPAILDEHIHGGFGISFQNSSEQEIRKLLKKLAQFGIGGFIATTLPDKTENISKQIKILNNIIKNPRPNETRILGIHLEGPFLNPQKSGIHPTEILLKPSVENYLKLEPENVKIVTLAPELDDNYELCRYLRKQGINVSAGHTVATAQQTVDSGINQVTHIFNAMKSIHQREESVTLEALINDNITAEMVGEFSHLSPKIMNLIMRQKPKDKLILISDALSNAGIKKDFIMNGVLIHVDDCGNAYDDNGVIAGNMQFLQNSAKKLVEKTIMTFKDFIRFASVNPAKNNGVYEKFVLEEGKTPLFSIWDNEKLLTDRTFTNIF